VRIICPKSLRSCRFAARKSNSSFRLSGTVGSITAWAKRSNFHGLSQVASSADIISAWNWPGFMSVTACIAWPPSTRTAVPL